MISSRTHKRSARISRFCCEAFRIGKAVWRWNRYDLFGDARALRLLRIHYYHSYILSENVNPMSSPPPTQGSKRHRVHDAVQQNVRRVRRAFRPSPGPRSCSPLESSAAPPHTQSPSHIPPEGPSLTISTHLTQRQTPGATQLIAGSSTPSANTSQVSATVTSHTTNPGPSTLKKLKNARKTAWAGLETALRALGRSADEFPPLRSAVDSLVACLDVVQVSYRS